MLSSCRAIRVAGLASAGAPGWDRELQEAGRVVPGWVRGRVARDVGGEIGQGSSRVAFEGFEFHCCG